MKLFFIVGEDSGDALAAPLIESIRENYGENIECLGVGGPKMKATGFNELLPMDQISIIGIWEVLPKIPRLLKLRKAIVEEIEKQNPDSVITVDFPDFNFLIAKELKKRGKYKGKIIHYVAPSVWAWRPGRAKNMASFLDGIMCLFPMEVDIFKKENLLAEHVGHPLVSSNAKNASETIFREENNIPDDATVLGLFFGSRESEFKRLSSVLKETALLVNEVKGEVHVVIPTLPHLEYDIQNIVTGLDLPMYVSANPNVKWEAFKSCDFAIAVSGTVALELSYAEIPHLIAYKLSPVTALILKFLVKVKHIHLANILLKREVVPEYLQSECIPEKITEEVLSYIESPKMRQEQVESFKELDALLHNSERMPPSEKAAAFIYEVINGNAVSDKAKNVA